MIYDNMVHRHALRYIHIYIYTNIHIITSYSSNIFFVIIHVIIIQVVEGGGYVSVS